MIAKNLETKKELKEPIRHGTSIFPFASYFNPGTYYNRVNLHWHPEVEVVKFISPCGQVNIDMQEYKINRSCIFFIPGNILHSYILPEKCIESAIVFDLNMLFFQSFDEFQYENFDELLNGNIVLPNFIYEDDPDFKAISDLFDYIADFQINDTTDHFIIKVKLLELMYILNKKGSFKRKVDSVSYHKSKQDKLKELLIYINNNHDKQLSVLDVANILGVTEQYFCRYFKKVLNVTFIEYLNDLRLRKIAQDLTSTNKQIMDIALDHGFENVGYFFKVFKAKFSVTPLKYRRMHQKPDNLVALAQEQSNLDDL